MNKSERGKQGQLSGLNTGAHVSAKRTLVAVQCRTKTERGAG